LNAWKRSGSLGPKCERSHRQEIELPVPRRRTFLAALLAVLVPTGVLTGAGMAAAESNGGVRVMPLGDSITEGTQVPAATA
jgi:hypothetical protein